MPDDATLDVTVDPYPEVAPELPVYDERGNVRPRGTEGAKPMTFAQRKRIADKLHKEATQ